MRNKRTVKPVKCGLSFSPTLTKDLLRKISAEVNDQLGKEIADALVFHELSTGLHVQFKTYWHPDASVFCLGKGVLDKGYDFDKDFICRLVTEREFRQLSKQVNSRFHAGKRALEWGHALRLVRLCVGISLDTQEGNDFWCVGDTRWLPEPFMRNHVRVCQGEEPRVFVSESEHDV